MTFLAGSRFQPHTGGTDGHLHQSVRWHIERPRGVFQNMERTHTGGQRRRGSTARSSTRGWQQVDLLQRAETVQIFVHDACLHQPQFTLTAQNAWQVERLCRALDGIPLAIALVAAQLSCRSLDQLLQSVHGRL